MARSLCWSLCCVKMKAWRELNLIKFEWWLKLFTSFRIKSLNINLIVLITFGFLQGCVAPPAYITPNNVPVAKLTINAGDPGGVNHWVIRFKGSMDKYNCSASPAEVIAILKNKSIFDNYADKGVNTNSVNLNIPATGEIFRFLIPAHYIKVRGNYVESTKCQAQIGFYPQPGREYLASYDFTKKQCEISLFEKSSNSQFHRIDKINYPPCLDNMGRNFIGRHFVLDYFKKHPKEYDGK